MKRVVVIDITGTKTVGNAAEVPPNQMAQFVEILKRPKEMNTLHVSTPKGEVYFNPAHIVSVLIEDV